MMQFQIRFISTCLAVLLVSMILPATLAAQTHVVKSGDLQQALLDASQQREENISKVEGFLSTDIAQQALKSFGLEPGKIKQGIPVLDDEELTQLASRTDEIMADFAAGEVSDRLMLYILIIVAVGSLIALLIVMP